jgi:hypothetical protein
VPTVSKASAAALLTAAFPPSRSGATALAVVGSALVAAIGPAEATGAAGVSISTGSGVLYDG